MFMGGYLLFLFSKFIIMGKHVYRYTCAVLYTCKSEVSLLLG